MLPTLAFLAIFPSAQASFESVTICFVIETDFTDPGGDWWYDNSIARLARGVHFSTQRVTTPPSPILQRQAEADGCEVVALDTDYDHTIRVRSEADVNGIALVSYTESEETEDREDLVLEFETFVLKADDTEQTFTIPWHQTWGNLAVGMWAIWRNDMDLGGPLTSRRCCYQDLSPNGCYNYDGTCDDNSSCDDESVLYGDPQVVVWDRAEVVFVNQTWTAADCCGSWWPGPGHDEQFPAVRVNWPWKYIIGHEMGHVMVESEMGRRTATSASAPLRGCMGAYKDSFDPADPGNPAAFCDADADPGKALLTREYQSMAAREGWASFYSSWLFNMQEDSCMFNTHVVHDFDLDGDIDNNYGDTGEDYGESYTRDGAYNCEGVGPAPGGGRDTGDPINGAMDARDWLKDVVNAGLCADGDTADTGTRLSHVGTEYDWHRYFWDMYDDAFVAVDDLAEIYKDACPTNWEAARTVLDDDEWPISRIEISADFHGKGTAHDNLKSNGQDH